MSNFFTLLTFALFYNFFGISCRVINNATDDNRDDEISFVIAGVRHGFRNPIKFLPNDTSRQKGEWGQEGAGLLTNFGKRLAYDFGSFLRQRYGAKISNVYKPDEVRSISSSSDRCQMSLQCVLASLFKPIGDDQGRFQDNLDWQPIPYSVNDSMLRVFESNCPQYLKIHHPFLTDDIPAAREFKKGKEALIEYITKNTGFSGTLLNMSHVADNIIAMQDKNANFPAWITKPTLPGYSKARMVQEVTSFAASSPILCATNETCARPLAGVWISDIHQQLSEKLAGKLPNRFLNLYATHIEGVMPVIRFMGANISNVPVSGGFLLELKKSIQAVRLVLFEPLKKSRNVRLTFPALNLPAAAGENWYKVPDFLDHIKPYKIDNFNRYCGGSKCDL